MKCQKIALLDTVICEETMTNLHETFPQMTIIFHAVDVTCKTELENGFQEVMNKFKSIDYVVACAGVLDEVNYKQTIDVNLVS